MLNFLFPSLTPSLSLSLSLTYIWRILSSQAHLAARDSVAQIDTLECLLSRFRELIRIVQCDQPEAGLRIIEMTMALAAVALDERSCTEIVQTRSSASQRLTPAAIADGRML